MEVLSKMEFELMEALHVFYVHKQTIHKYGSQNLRIEAIENAAEVFDRYKDRYLAMFPRKDGV